MEVRKNLKYTKDHEWARIEGKVAYVGITDYAQHELGDIVFVEVPAEGKTLIKGDVLGTVESSKAASDIFTPLPGKVAEGNKELENKPELINEKPYEAWIAKLEVSGPSVMDGLMGSDEYEAYIKGLD